MRIASWNVNSVRQRTAPLLDYLRDVAPDVLCLQELKCQDDAFPRAEVEDAGYIVETFGQKTFNGVALLSKTPLEDVSRGLPGFEDAQARYIEGVVGDGAGGVYRVASIYLPNGNPPDSEKYGYKLAFMDALTERARALLALEERVVLAGDYNVIPAPEDVYDPVGWAGDALFKPANPREVPPACSTSATRRRCAPSRTRPPFILFGIIRPAPGKRITACASTIFCCRRRPPTA